MKLMLRPSRSRRRRGPRSCLRLALKPLRSRRRSRGSRCCRVAPFLPDNARQLDSPGVYALFVRDATEWLDGTGYAPDMTAFPST